MSTLSQNNSRSDPRVTVVIPCHNHEDFVKNAVDSAISQEYDNKKIVVIDDGSTDGSRRVIEFMSRSMGIEAIYNNFPTGPSAARNIAIQKFWNDTDFFCVLDADDTYLPGKIDMSVGIMKEDPVSIGLVYADVIIRNIKNNTEILELRRPYSRGEIEKECIISNTPLINKLALDQVGLYDETMRTAVHIPMPLSTYSVTGFNASDTIPSEVWYKNWEKIRERIKSQHASI